MSARLRTTLHPGLDRKLKSAISGDVYGDLWDRGRYSTDASIYQIMPHAVVVPKTLADVSAAIEIATQEGVPVLPRGGGTSQCGQTVNQAVVIDTSKHLNKLISLDVENKTCVVEPGIVLDELNRALKPHGLWFPVDVSTSSRCTIGGMTGNNSCGGRSIRYGMMRDNVRALDAILSDGHSMAFGPLSAGSIANQPDHIRTLIEDLQNLGHREADEIASSFPKVQRRVGGYNIDALTPRDVPINLATLLVGSEGTLAFTTRITLKLSPLPGHKVMGICHFPTFYAAMASTKEIVKLGPTAVELIDSTMLDLARRISMFQPVVDRAVRGRPAALLIVEFAEEDHDENRRRLKQLSDLMGDLGFAWSNDEKTSGGVVEAIEPAFQSSVTEVRKSGLNIMMSMKSEGKPVSFVEDCAVELEDLAEYTDRLTGIFEKHGTRGTWYAHASVGCLHVRPVLNLKLDQDVKAMRAIAEEAFEMVREYKGSHSGEHGDGIVRSEFNEVMFGARMADNFREIKRLFDPKGVFNPGKIIDAPKMDDRTLFRYSPDYRVEDIKTALDWSAWPGKAGGLQGAIEMCNNNGACRKLTGGAMCPSYRVTRNERDLTRGRANSLRLALSGQLGNNALASDAMAETMKLCVGCKACKRECPTGVDMARMKIEAAHARKQTHGTTLQDRLIAHLPRYAPWASRLAPLMNLRNTFPGAAALAEPLTGFTAKRRLPTWRTDPFSPTTKLQDPNGSDTTPIEAILFADTFNTYFEPENLRSAERVLTATGKTIGHSWPAGEKRPLCCGRTYLSVGLVDEAKREARRLIEALLPHVRRGAKIVGLEPSCLLTLRDELTVMHPGKDADDIAKAACMFEEYIVEEAPELPLQPVASKAYLHGHCHQKAHNVMSSVEAALRMIPDLDVAPIESSCCGMAGAFGYGSDTHETSRAMGELSLLPAVRQAEADALIVADGTSCRHQIADGTDRTALHVARIFDKALA